MREIEVKAKVQDQDVLIKALINLGCELGEEFLQDDRIFVKNPSIFPKLNPGESVLRIRTQGDTHILTLKQSQGDELNCLERESVIGDPMQVRDMLELMGYVEVCRVNKRRRKGKIEDVEVCVDHVDTLGAFVELEKMSEEEGSVIQAELFSILEKCGVSKDDQVFHGYDTLITRNG